MQLILTLLLSMLSVAAHSSPVNELLELQRLTLVNGCRLYALTGESVASFPGTMCIFLPDGTFVSGSETHLRYFSKTDEILWEIPGHFHHQLNLSPDGKRILALSSAPAGNEREDRFLVLDLNGKILHSQTAQPLLTATKTSRVNLRMSAPIGALRIESSHFNSIYEVPKLEAPNLPPYLREGNIIVNSTHIGVFILSPDLQQVLFHTTFANSRRHNVHDVQVTRRGTFLYFNNMVESGQPQFFQVSGAGLPDLWSAVNELDPRSGKLVQTFEAQPRHIFYSFISSNVQEVTDDIWLFTHFMNGTYFYSKSRRELILAVPGTHYSPSGFMPTQQVRAQRLIEFLRARER